MPCLQQPRLWTKKRDFLPTQCFWLTAGPSCRVFNHQEGTRSSATSDRSCPCFKNKTSVTLQWIPSHCGFGGNEEADWLSKMGSKLEQSAQPMPYSESKTILRNNFRTEWQQRLDIGTEEDSIHQLDRAAQVIIFRLRTGHCQLLSHLHRLKTSHSDECPCGTGPQPPQPHPAPPSMTWEARHSPVWWRPTGSFGDLLRHCGRLRTSPYSPDWKSSMAGNAEEEEETLCEITGARHFTVLCTCSLSAKAKVTEASIGKISSWQVWKKLVHKYLNAMLTLCMCTINKQAVPTHWQRKFSLLYNQNAQPNCLNTLSNFILRSWEV